MYIHSYNPCTDDFPVNHRSFSMFYRTLWHHVPCVEAQRFSDRQTWISTSWTPMPRRRRQNNLTADGLYRPSRFVADHWIYRNTTLLCIHLRWCLHCASASTSWSAWSSLRTVSWCVERSKIAFTPCGKHHIQLGTTLMCIPVRKWLITWYIYVYIYIYAYTNIHTYMILCYNILKCFTAFF